jgi:predicted permease
LLLSNEEEKNTQGATRVKFLLKKLKPLVNPMFIAMIIGMLLGLIGIESLLKSALGDMMPEKIFFLSAIEQTGSCMSVLAMIITGMTIAQTDIMYILKNVPIYILTVVRLLVIPLVFIFVFWLIPENSLTKDVTFLTCAICALSMPLGLNTIVVPGAYGKDTRDAAGMALISHALAVVTIPLIFMIFNSVLIA